MLSPERALARLSRGDAPPNPPSDRAPLALPRHHRRFRYRDEVQTVLLILTLFVSGLTFGGVRTNVLPGTVHILLFIVYVALIFSL
jgi:hypothetical protein